MDLAYSLDGEINRIVFYSSLNDINIFVEDKDKEHEYEIIFNRMFDNQLKISTIFGVGGKQSLFKAYDIIKDFKVNQVANVLIADMDFDFILDRDMVRDDTFIYLDHYCIENYLIDEEASICFIQGRLGRLQNEVKKILAFDNWNKETTEQFYELFILFLIVQDNCLNGVCNTGESTFRYLVNSSWEVDKQKLQEYYDTVKSHLSDLDTQIAKMKSNVHGKVGSDICRIISGKYYFDSLKMYLRKISGHNIYDVDLKSTLLRHFDVTKLDYLKNAILQVCNKYKVAS